MSDWFAPVIFDRGDDCLTCYGAGGTPLHYYVQFQGIERGALWIPADGQPPNNLYDLTQKVGSPCIWEQIFLGLNKVYLQYGPANTLLKFVFDFPLTAFDSFPAVICRRFHFNAHVAPAGNHFWGGFGFVFTPTEMQALIESVTPVVDPDPLLKVSPMAGGLIVVSYIDEWGDTKFKMKVDTTV